MSTSKPPIASSITGAHGYADSIQVMLVDDSAIILGLLGRTLIKDTNISIVATASNGAQAIPLAAQHKPQIIILDIEMPEMDGITALPKLLEASPNTRIIMASTLTQRNAYISLKALSLGASDYVAKPSASNAEELGNFYRDLIEKIQALAKPKMGASSSAPSIIQAKPIVLVKAPPVTTVKALAIASSTGGPQALKILFNGIRGQFKNIPIFITQHMPPVFTAILADNLAKEGDRHCVEGKEGMAVKAGETYVAPGDHHMLAEKTDAGVILRLNQEPPENFCRPAADPMLRSLSKIYGSTLFTIVLTGMGSDGAEGAKVVVNNGGHVVAQDEASCVVWGMPRAAAEAGVCRAILPLNDIAPYLIRTFGYAT
ncbi:MAG: chemotaxis response regulator protein-glutamate methylesterase [Alphaproteobacteria bacterium]